MSRENEDESMREIVRIYSGIAASLQLADRFMKQWLPVRAAVSEACGVNWDGLSHSLRTIVGDSVRYWFREEHPAFPLTPVRLLPKSNGGGSHMIAVYPPDWLLSKRDAISALLGGATPKTPLLPFD